MTGVQTCALPISESMFVCHKCDNRLCVNPEHLFLGTHKDNMKDMANKGRRSSNPIPKDSIHISIRGTKHPKNKLSEQQVLCIFKDIRKQKDIAKEYGITQEQVSSIKCLKTWAWLTNSIPK